MESRSSGRVCPTATRRVRCGRPVDPKKESVDLQLVPLDAAIRGPFRFVVASDAHMNIEQPFWPDLAHVADDATAIRPAFFTILGDVTQGDRDAEFDLVAHDLTGLAAPYVPVPGNHDWYDGGGTWHHRVGPDNYSFDIDRTHFVVWNMAIKGEDLRTFLAAELAHVDPAMTVVALAHAPPPPQQIEILRLLGVKYLLTGHNHANRTWDHGGLRELNTEPLLMSGIDHTPGGYRIVTVDKGALTSEHRTVSDGPYMSLLAPACVTDTVFVAAAIDAGTTTVTAAIDCAAPIPLTPAGGWDFRLSAPTLPAGGHRIELEARSSTGRVATRVASYQVCGQSPPPRIGADWPQLGGGPAHTGAVPRELAPPLTTRWVQAIGGHALQATPAISHGMVFVTATDLADGTTGGVVALDVATGAVRWRHATSVQVRGGPAITGNTVAVAQVDATLLGLDLETGEERWHAPLGTDLEPQAAAIFASVATDAGDFLVGDQNLFGAFDAATGTPLWTDNPVHEGRDSQSLAAIAIADDIAVGVFNRAIGGVGAWDRATGRPLWRINDARTTAIDATPVISNGLVYVVNGMSDVFAIELATGAARWQTRLDPTGFDWGYATIGTPAIAHGILVVPTLYGDLVGLDAASGRVQWRVTGQPAPIRATHYRGKREGGWEASPVITGDLVWAADTSGELYALELRTGRTLWRVPMQTPVLAGLAVSGDALVVAGFDGTVRLLAPGTAPSKSPQTCLAPQGCCDAHGSSASPLALAGLWLRPRKRRPLPIP